MSEIERFQQSLQRWLSEEWGDASLTVADVAPFGGGNSGQTFVALVASQQGTDKFVVRSSVPGVRLAGPNDVGRQGRIMAALSTAGAPSPRVHALVGEPLVDERAVVVLEKVDADGWEAVAARDGHESVAAAAIGALHALQGVQSDALTTELGPAEGPADELSRWFRLMERAELGNQAKAKQVVDRLLVAPPTVELGLVHGDFHYGNLLLRDGEVVAVIDWEIASHGPLLSDLGALAVASLRRRYGDPNPTGNVDISLPTLVALYGADPEAAGWMVASSCVKYAAIIAYNLRLHRQGRKHDPIYEDLQVTLDRLLDDASAILEGGLGVL